MCTVHRSLCCCSAHRRMRIKHVSGLSINSLDGFDGLLIRDSLALKVAPSAPNNVAIYRSKEPFLVEVLEPLINFLTGLSLVPEKVHARA